MGKKPVDIAIIGAGFISDYHVNGIRSAGGGSLRVLVGRDHNKTQHRAADLGISESSTDYQAVLAREDIDAVVITTPDVTHSKMAIEALNTGKHVLLQKPMAMTSQECLEVLSVAEKAQANLTVSFMHRYFPEVQWLREVLRQNRFGQVHSVRIRNATPGAGWSDWFYDPTMVAGGVVMQLGVHGIDLVQHLFGPIQSVLASVSTKCPTRELDDGRIADVAVEDNAAAIYQLASGIQVSHEMSWTEVAGCDRFRLEVYFDNGTVWLRTARGAALFASRPAGNSSPEWSVPTLTDAPFGQAHHRHWLEIIRQEAVEDGTAKSGLSSTIVGERIYESARLGKKVYVDQR